MMKSQEIKDSFTLRPPILLNRCGCFSLWFITFIQGDDLSKFIFICWHSFFEIFECLILQFHYTFKVFQI